MARTKSDAGPALTAAYAELVKGGRAVTVRALREMASVSTAAAAAWLKDNRPSPEAPSTPSEELRPAVDSLWAVAVAFARDEATGERATAVDAHAASEAAALEEAFQLRVRLEAQGAEQERVQAELTQLREQLATDHDRAQGERRELLERSEKAERAAEAERERARSAEARAERAEATAATLQRIVDDHLRPAGGK